MSVIMVWQWAAMWLALQWVAAAALAVTIGAELRRRRG